MSNRRPASSPVDAFQRMHSILKLFLHGQVRRLQVERGYAKSRGCDKLQRSGNLGDDVARQGAVKGDGRIKHLEHGLLVLHEHSDLDGTVGGADKVVRVATGEARVKGRLAAGVAGSKSLPKVEFTAAGGPARARGRAVLESAGDLSVEHPNGRHVHVVTRSAIIGHGELHEEELLSAVEAI